MRSEPLSVFELSPHPGGTGMVTLRASVKGEAGTFLFDTGGGLSYITPGFAKQIGCEPWGRISGFTMTGVRLDMARCDDVVFEMGGQRFPVPSVGVFDLMKFMPEGVPRLDGSIGLDLFAGRTVTLSLADRKLIVESPGSLAERVKTAKSVQIRLVREAGGLALAVQAAVGTPKGPAWMEFDTGNGGANVVSSAIAELVGLDPTRKEPQDGTLTLVGGTPVKGPFRTNDKLTMDGNIGVGFLKDWDLTLDLRNGLAWVAPPHASPSRSVE
jgi:hypothetical protein